MTNDKFPPSGDKPMTNKNSGLRVKPAMTSFIEYGLYLLVFLLPIQTRWIIKAGMLNGGYWEYGTYGLYATDILLIMLLILYVICRFLKASNDQVPMTNDQANFKFPWVSQDKQISNFKRIQALFIGGLVLMAGVSVFSAAYKLLAIYKFGWLILGAGQKLRASGVIS